MTTLSPQEVAGRQDEMDRLRRVWRAMLAQQKAMSPAAKAEQAARWAAEARAKTKAYHAELRAALDREIYPIDLGGKLVDAGVEPQHLEGLRRGLDERAAFTATRRWWSQPKVQAGLVDVVDEATGEIVKRPKLAREYPFLVLAGGSGLGKSQAAAWCVREAARTYPWNREATGSYGGRPFAVWHGSAVAATTLYGNHSAAAGDDAEREWREAERAVLLVLDDLFCQRSPLSKPHQDRLTRLLTARHGAARSTILTVNMDGPTLADLLDGKGSEQGGPLFRRIVQGGHLVTLQRKSATTLVGGRVS